MLGRIYHLLLKEFLQLRRDKSARIRLLVPPIIQMLLFGYAATFEVFNVATVILDQDQSQESRALVAAVGRVWFQVPFNGNILVLLLGTCLFLLSALAIGLLISTLCKTQQQAFSSNFFVLNPMFILSGFSFPISSMPEVLQWLTYLDPLRYFLVIIRDTYLKGVGFAVVWPQMLGLSVLGLSLFTIAVLRMRKSMD